MIHLREACLPTSYLGHGAIVQVDYQEPDIRYDLAFGAGNDPCDGLDRFDRVSDLLWRNHGASTDAVRIKHGYDRAGNRLWREDPVAAANSNNFDELYSYDGVYQLRTLDRGDLNANHDAITSKAFAEDWSLDATGNWCRYRKDDDGNGTWELDQTRSHDKANEITLIAGSSSHVSHDRAGNMTKVPKSDDWNAHYDLTYDAWNRLVKVMDGQTTVAEYSYDARNFRVKKIVSGTTRHFYYNNAWQCLEDRLGSSTYADRQFVWGQRYIDDLILRDRDADSNSGTGNLGLSGSGLEERLYCHQDPNWNVVAISNTSGTAQERYAYDAYGRPTFLTGSFGSRATSSYAWETLFAGYRWDSEVRFYYVRNRVLVPNVNWLLRDPIESDVNLYRYVANSPVIYVDPTGLWKVKRAGAAKAEATTEDGDTIDALGPRIGLNSRHFRWWLTIPRARKRIQLVTGFYVSADDVELGSLPLCGGQTFDIPNTVLAYWAGWDFLGIGKGFVYWDVNVAYLKKLGFWVLTMDHVTGDTYALQNKLEKGAGLKVLHGLYFHGHGLWPYPSAGLESQSGDPLLKYYVINLPYKMALGLVFACDSNSGRFALSSNSRGHIWHGYTNTFLLWKGFWAGGGLTGIA